MCGKTHFFPFLPWKLDVFFNQIQTWIIPCLPLISGTPTNSRSAWNEWEAWTNAGVDLNKENVQFYEGKLRKIGGFPKLNPNLH